MKQFALLLAFAPFLASADCLQTEAQISAPIRSQIVIDGVCQVTVDIDLREPGTLFLPSTVCPLLIEEATMGKIIAPMAACEASRGARLDGVLVLRDGTLRLE